MKTKVPFLNDANDKVLKTISYAKPKKINFHMFRVGEVIYKPEEYANEMYIIAQGTVEIRFEGGINKMRSRSNTRHALYELHKSDTLSLELVREQNNGHLNLGDDCDILVPGDLFGHEEALEINKDKKGYYRSKLRSATAIAISQVSVFVLPWDVFGQLEMSARPPEATGILKFFK